MCCKCCDRCCSKEPSDGLKDIVRKRSCKDVLFLAIFLAFIGAFVVITIVGAANGNAPSLFFATDYSGNTCGSANMNIAETSRKDHSSKQYIVYPRLSEDMVMQAEKALTDPLSVSFFGICVKDCPASGGWVCKDEVGKYDEKWLNTCKNKAGGGQFLSKYDYNDDDSNCTKLMRDCWQMPFSSTSIMFRCLYEYNVTVFTPAGGKLICTDPPNTAADSDKCVKTQVATTTVTEQSAQEDLLAKQLATFTAILTRYIADLTTAGPAILVLGGLGAALFGFIWLGLLRYLAGCFVWFAIWLFLLALLAATAYAYAKAGIISVSTLATQATVQSGGLVPNLNNGTVDTTSSSLTGLGPAAEQSDKDLFTAIAIICSFTTVVYMMIIIFTRRKIRVAVAIIKETSKAIAHMPLIMAFPITTVIGVVAMFLVWSWTFGNIYTMGSVEVDDFAGAVQANANVTAEVSNYVTHPLRDWVLAFLVFALFWMNAFIQGVATMTICGAFASWYWSEVDPDSGKKIYKDDRPVAASLYRTVRYSLGSIAFGSLIIAVCQFLRAVLGYISRKTKGAQGKNALLKCIFKILNCCLYCFEKCVKYISRKAYIIIAIKGSSFCSATVTVFQLLLSNGGSIAVVNIISGMMMILGKLLIVACSVALGFLVFQFYTPLTSGNFALISTVLPLILVGILAWFVATGFLSVFDHGIDSLLISYIVDLKENKEGQYMFSESLARAAGKGGQTRAAHAEEGITETSQKYVAETHFKDPEVSSDNGEGDTIVEPGELI